MVKRIGWLLLSERRTKDEWGLLVSMHGGFPTPPAPPTVPSAGK